MNETWTTKKCNSIRQLRVKMHLRMGLSRMKTKRILERFMNETKRNLNKLKIYWSTRALWKRIEAYIIPFGLQGFWLIWDRESVGGVAFLHLKWTVFIEVFIIHSSHPFIELSTWSQKKPVEKSVNEVIKNRRNIRYGGKSQLKCN